MKISLEWLRSYVDLPESAEELRLILDDLGLVVEGVERIGEGLEDVVVAEVREIRAIEGADKIRLVVVDTGDGPLEIVCGAQNFAEGDRVPLAPVGAVLPGGFAIGRRTMRGVVSNGMLCSGRELGLSEDHGGLLILDEAARPGVALTEHLGIEPDIVFDLSIEGNRPDAWCVLGVARDLAARLGRPLRVPEGVLPAESPATASAASGFIGAPELCERLTVSVLRGVRVGPSPEWVRRRLEAAGMRSISNVVDASNYVMLELGQPTHPYDATLVEGRAIGVRAARPGETLTTLDDVERELAKPGRGLGDTGVDCVIVDGADRVIGLAGIMGGASSEINDATTEVLLEAASFDPMTIARSVKRHGLRSEAAARFERGVDPELALAAVARFVEVLRESSPEVVWLAEPIDVRGALVEPSTIELRDGDVERLLGAPIGDDEVERLLRALDFEVSRTGGVARVTAPSRRRDIRAGAAGRADVLEEVARLHGYSRLPRRTPTWTEPGRLSERQRLRRRVRDVLVDLGGLESWTESMVSEEEATVMSPGVARVRVANPLAQDQAILRDTLVSGLLRAYARNAGRGLGDLASFEIGVVFSHPETGRSRMTRGGEGGQLEVALPGENERVSVLLGRDDDDATTAVAWWSVIAERVALADVVVRTCEAPVGWHPTRTAQLVDRASGAQIGLVGELDPDVIAAVTGAERRIACVDLDFDALADPSRATRRGVLAKTPSRFPSATIDLAFVCPDELNAADLALILREASELVESVELFDVYRGPGVGVGTRSLAYTVRLSSTERTLDEGEVQSARQTLIDAAGTRGATLR